MEIPFVQRRLVEVYIDNGNPAPPSAAGFENNGRIWCLFRLFAWTPMLRIPTAAT
jgi:hypothetical protein